MKTAFRVQDTQLFADFSLLQSGNFEVQSIPKSYPVEFLRETDPIAAIEREFAKDGNNLILIDANICSLYRRPNVPLAKVLEIKAIEDEKSLLGVLKVIDFLNQNQFTKADTLIVVGGGIVEDIGAFSSAIYRRGIRWVYFPTTLLSMADSCIGGKTALNHESAKNQLALFSNPDAVLLNAQFLKTLAPRDLLSGYGEILKLAITAGGAALEIYEVSTKDGISYSPDKIEPLIRLALLIKKAVVEKDQFELDLRRVLNYGHTLGHAIEAMTDFKIPHGQAVSLGMWLINNISRDLGHITTPKASHLNYLILRILEKDLLPLLREPNLEALKKLISKDKKTLGKKAKLVLPEEPGYFIFKDFELSEENLQKVGNLFSELANQSP